VLFRRDNYEIFWLKTKKRRKYRNEPPKILWCCEFCEYKSYNCYCRYKYCSMKWLNKEFFEEKYNIRSIEEELELY
jgi:hypothetical protein